MSRLTILFSSLLLAVSSLATHAANKTPQISIIIDDLGNNLRAGQRAIDLPGAVTYAVLPFTPFGKKLARQAHQQGKEIMLHLPMDNRHNRPLGPGALTFKQDRPRFEQQLAAAIAETPYISGLNNHMGSGLTTSAERMQWLMQSLRQYPLYFVDSRTSVASVANNTALAQNIPSLERDVFLDHQATPEFIDQQFKRLLKKAHRNGQAIAIGHPYPSTLDYLEQALPQLEKLGVELVSPSQLLALTNTPQQVASKTQHQTTEAATINPPTRPASKAEKIAFDALPAPTATALANTPADLEPGQCRITEQLNITRIICS